ncbi:helix-turn-helix domain-containing protein [Chryseobacterium sp. SIMBA_038]|uniref:helix-turn-helix domain-containing protein n=1 Tax=Chryseobacterium sp. SIMBA_038 TaxID=3085780 RepID=UPI00397B1378
MARTEIALHRDELTTIGIEISPIVGLCDMWQTPHRDDHFMFIIQKKGDFIWELDFREVVLSGPSICYIATGQVHRYLEYKDCEGWFVFVETALIPKVYLEVFNACQNSHQIASIVENNDIFSFIPVFESIIKSETTPFQNMLISSLTDSLMGMMVKEFIQTQNSEGLIGGTKYKTVIQFKQLVQANYKELKLVKEYASLLNITPLYLNEIVKEITGFSASHWIHQEIIIEAQRLLYYTDLDIKQIAFQLGYEDYTYFSRFFKKNAGLTASKFREQKPLFVQP